MKTFLALTTGFLSGFIFTCTVVALMENEEKESNDICDEEEEA